MLEAVTTSAAARRLADYLLEKGLGGAGPLASARELADEYVADARFASRDERADALIERETFKNFTTGFVTGLGGAITLPVSVPSALVASWLIQARMAGAIASLYGHDLAAERTHTTVLLSLAGDVARDALRDFGLPPAPQLTRRALEQVPGRALVEINKRIGLRLLSRAGERSVSGFSRLVPVVGGIVGGTLDAVVCRMVGRTAKSMLRRPEGEVYEGEILLRGD